MKIVMKLQMMKMKLEEKTEKKITEIEYMQVPWIFGLYCNNDNKTECRFLIVENINRQTLLPIIEREV